MTRLSGMSAKPAFTYALLAVVLYQEFEMRIEIVWGIEASSMVGVPIAETIFCLQVLL